MSGWEDREDDEAFFAALRAREPEAFWARQKREILDGIRARRGGLSPAWRLAPVLAAAFAMAFLLARREETLQVAEVPPPQDWGLLESLELLENWEAIETMDEGERGT